MCLLVLLQERVPDSRLVVWANREERYARPSDGPAWRPGENGGLGWVGGKDASAGGTWLGVNRAGLLVAVTNRRDAPIRHNPMSRGLLCRRLLSGSASVAHASDECLEALKNHPVSGCNVVIADAVRVVVIEHTVIEHTWETIRSERRASMTFVANDKPDDPADLRLRRVRRWIESDRPESRAEAVELGQRVCAAIADGVNPPICLTGTDHGTVSSAVLAMDASGRWIDYQYTSGPPHQTPFVDGSGLLTRLLP